MTDQEFQIAVIAIVFGTGVAITFLIIIGTIIRTWLKNRSGVHLADNEEFLEALRHFKKKTDRRLSNLEAMIIDDEPVPMSGEKISPPKDTEEIEFEGEKNKREIEGEKVKKKEETKNRDQAENKNKKNHGGNLKNMLDE